MPKSPLTTICLSALLVAAPAAADEMSAVVLNNTGEKIGSIKARSGPHGLVLLVTLGKGSLSPGAHGIHVHEHGDCSDHGEFKKSKGHVNPDNKEHGFLNEKGPHPSDLPNLWAHDDGSVLAEMFVPGLSISGGKASLADEDGSAVVVHANADDHISQPIGGAGARVACAVFKK